MNENLNEKSNKITNYEPVVSSNKTLANIDTLELYSQAKEKILKLSSKSYSLLDELITQIHHEGNLGDVQIVMEKVDNTINRYRRDTWRRVVFPAPLMLIASIEGRFKKEANISRLLIINLAGKKVSSPHLFPSLVSLILILFDVTVEGAECGLYNFSFKHLIPKQLSAFADLTD